MEQGKYDYDVVVIGSGIGGLEAGALLVHTGYKTLVVEKLIMWVADGSLKVFVSRKG